MNAGEPVERQLGVPALRCGPTRAGAREPGKQPSDRNHDGVPTERTGERDYAIAIRTSDFHLLIAALREQRRTSVAQREEAPGKRKLEAPVRPGRGEGYPVGIASDVGQRCGASEKSTGRRLSGSTSDRSQNSVP